ncbi:MAG TPA: hypothetical protein PKE55_08580 [Kiritimatiellia bacterium]|nr:hypothetical protein [Kiritimatiellia bacterium]
MKASTRILINTLAMYSRSLVAMGLSLFSARWVLQALGPVDFGLFGVIGSIILLIAFINDGMAVGVARFYAYAIGQSVHLPGQDAQDHVTRWFNTALSIHLLLPAGLVALGYPLGAYAIEHWLTIPPERIDACLWVLRISLVTAMINVASVPFTALFTAYQHIAELALFGLIGSVLTFAGAYSLLAITSDRLIVYALYMMAIGGGIPLLLIARAFIKYPACRVRLRYLFNRSYLRELFGFVGWKMYGMSCVVFRNQGAPVLINLQFGPHLNAAYSIAQRVSIQADSLAAAMAGAFQPVITTMEGGGQRDRMIEAAMQISKFGAYLVLLFVLPLMIEMDTVLTLWLGNPPAYAGMLCSFMLAMLVMDKMTSGYMMAVNAHGRIARYELVQGPILLFALPLMWLLFRQGAGPVAVGVALAATMAAYCLGRLVFCRYLLGIPVGPWFRHVALPVSIMIGLAVAGGLGLTGLMPAGFLRVSLTTMACLLTLSTAGWFILLNEKERMFMRSLATRILRRS